MRLARFSVLAVSVGWMALFAAGCGSNASEDEELVGKSDDGDGTQSDLSIGAGMSAPDIRATSTAGFTVERPTQLGRTVFAASRLWMSRQDPTYAMPRNCANNVSIVLRSALRAESLLPMTAKLPYEAESVFSLVESVRKAPGSHVVDMPLLADDGKFVAAYEREFPGGIPVGTVVAGCPRTFPRCNGEGGSQHVALIGHTDENGVVWVYHNNWLRPENLGGRRPANLAPYMVSEANLRSGHPRQWMPTPWVRLTRDAGGHVIKAERMLKEIDDMDPAQYYMKLAVIPELQKQLTP
jgi:hypothetical protein